jgi:RNA polymerase sigma factor (sigma-70 family)
MRSNNTGTDLTDAAIIVASERDPALFAQIFDRHWTRVHRYCVSRAGAAGEDIAAETFRVALDSRRRFDRSRVDAGPWLFGIATNLLRHRLRSETRRTRALARLHLRDEADVADGALDRIEAEALGPEVAAALAQLSPKYRDALLLHVWAICPTSRSPKPPVSRWAPSALESTAPAATSAPRCNPRRSFDD